MPETYRLVVTRFDENPDYMPEEAKRVKSFGAFYNVDRLIETRAMEVSIDAEAWGRLRRAMVEGWS